ncbi:hypothetical protein ABIB94_001094 [Bradyrhizobium sp. JR7.2]|uniref:hypothetical protein n=1 Tax=Bradyrhizobium TaxID=374 RepID=UPI0024AF178A|nr:hypothetical protein [Bradyrhizobium barranii]WFT93506.1 hypothetical protein QA633_35205 [Bradyrhizobium barranii]
MQQDQGPNFNGEERQVMQADEKIGLMRALAGKSSARGHCDKYQTIAQRAQFSPRQSR